MGTLCQDYSGVFLDQNATPTGLYPWRADGGSIIYQTFELPTDFTRGSLVSEQRIPDLSGFQVLVSVETGYKVTASMNCTIDYILNGITTNVATGTVIGTHAEGPYVWFDCVLASPIPISEAMLEATWRIGASIPSIIDGPFNQPVVVGGNGVYGIGSQVFTANLIDGIPYPISVNGVPAFLLLQGGVVTWYAQQGIIGAYYVQPTPIVGQALQFDGATPLYSPPASLNFRVLALDADSGTDFLGNEYRSVVITAPSDNVQTTLGNTPVSGGGQNPYWMSQVFPSPTAVESLYFDMRPVQSSPVYGLIQYIGNPSFEYDATGQAPAWWAVVDTGVGATATVSAAWSMAGVQSLSLLGSFTGAEYIGVDSPLLPFPAITGGNPTPLNLSFAYNIVTLTGASLSSVITFYDATSTPIGSPTTTTISATGIGISSVNVNAPTGTAFVGVMIQLGGATGSGHAYIDAIQITATPTLKAYFDGDSINCIWLGQAGDSQSAQDILLDALDEFAVIDGILLDPITPNMNFNVYYSQDDSYTSANMSQSDWDQKLWYRVPQVFIATGRQQYVFPDPVHAKYMKVEFTNPQGQSYNPGDFQLPIQYQQFPTWVTNYFLANNNFEVSTVAGTVNVQYDALGILYLAYTGDLVQAPAPPISVPSDVQSTLSDYWNPNAVANVDSFTLSQINLVNGFKQPLGAVVPQNTVGSITTGLLANQTAGLITVVEGDQVFVPNLTSVSSLQRESVLNEQIAPDMYFFLTCRHTYKVSAAVFDQHRGYTFGVNDIAFLRNDYTVPSDTPLYIESSGDDNNTAFNDFDLGSDGNWYTYDNDG